MTSQSTEIDFLVTSLNDTAIVQVSARFTVLEAVSFKQTCQSLIQANSHLKQMIIDFHQTTFMDSSGLGALVSNFKYAESKGIALRLRNVTPEVMSVLKLTGLDQVFSLQFFDNESLIEQQNLIHIHKTSSRQIEHLPATHPSVASWMKRFIDIVGSLVGLLITGVLFIPIAIAIQMDDPGTIFFSQTRCGWMGKRFKIWKFRSMCMDAEAKKFLVENQAKGAFFKNKNES
ncbi:hypothetical protein ANSO36C_43010 [Nostoc cf. commune SO-36]|uniref:Anti-sigma factor antagonist n=1 Tax=Nostoc cf. commune SO-36 TaxID=449208 RepID=A0ABM7Z5Y3_NOSCO|nr:hypothetical protein ANSO36C_43010 [Nostoc cf. commune SO-36]